MRDAESNIQVPKILLIYQKASSTFTAYPWLFAGSGYFQVEVIAPKKHPIRFSRWISQHIPYETNAELLELLLEKLGKWEEYCLFHFADESSRNFAYEKLRHNANFLQSLPFPEETGLIDACLDKVLFQNWCEKHQLPVPASRIANSPEQVRQYASEFDFPYLLKGATGSRGSTVFKIEDSSMIDAALANCPEVDSWLIQQFIEGRVGTTSFISIKGVLCAVTSLYKDVSLGGGLGPVAVARPVHNESLLELAEKVAAMGKISGITGFDWMEDASGTYYIIDSHLGRAPANLILAKFQGVALDEALASALKGEGGLHLPKPIERRVWLMPQMFVLLFEGRIKEALKLGSPLDRHTSIFWYAKGEWRMFLSQVSPYLIGRTRVLLGRLRQLPGRCLGKK